MALIGLLVPAASAAGSIKQAAAEALCTTLKALQGTAGRGATPNSLTSQIRPQTAGTAPGKKAGTKPAAAGAKQAAAGPRPVPASKPAIKDAADAPAAQQLLLTGAITPEDKHALVLAAAVLQTDPNNQAQSSMAALLVPGPREGKLAAMTISGLQHKDDASPEGQRVCTQALQTHNYYAVAGMQPSRLRLDSPSSASSHYQRSVLEARAVLDAVALAETAAAAAAAVSASAAAAHGEHAAHAALLEGARARIKGFTEQTLQDLEERISALSAA